MNCDSLQRCVLHLERPDRPPEEARYHLFVCGACREWHRQLIDAERLAANLPVPPPQRKQAFLARLAAPPKAGDSGARRAVKDGRPVPARPNPERARWKMAIAFAMAAGLLVVAFGAWAWKRSNVGPSPRHPETLLEAQLKAEPRWARARTPERLEILAELADKARYTAQELAATDKEADLARQVQFFKEVVHAMTVEAPRLSDEDRARVLLPLVERLARAESDAERVAARLLPSAVALRELAATARDGERRLRDML